MRNLKLGSTQMKGINKLGTGKWVKFTAYLKEMEELRDFLVSLNTDIKKCDLLLLQRNLSKNRKITLENKRNTYNQFYGLVLKEYKRKIAQVDG